MIRDYNNLATSIKFGCLWTVVLQVLSLSLTDTVYSDYRLSVAALPMGWVPILAIALRRPDHPSRTDVGVIFAGFPLVSAGLAVFGRWYFHTP